MNFEPQMIKIIINLFDNQKAHIIKDGEFSESFKVGKGVRQGDSLLYILAFEPLLKRLERDIQGIPVGGPNFKLVAYADDLSVVNREKAKLVPLTANAKRVVLVNETQYKKVDEHETIKILGHDLHLD
ncbi:25513_t:CDS:2, partial [Gigaspora rosea]